MSQEGSPGVRESESQEEINFVQHPPDYRTPRLPDFPTSSQLSFHKSLPIPYLCSPKSVLADFLPRAIVGRTQWEKPI